MIVLGALVAIFGIAALVGASQTNAACTGDIVDTALCEGAQLRQSIFGGLVGVALITGTAVLAGATLIAERIAGTRDTDSDPRG